MCVRHFLVVFCILSFLSPPAQAVEEDNEDNEDAEKKRGHCYEGEKEQLLGFTVACLSFWISAKRTLEATCPRDDVSAS